MKFINYAQNFEDVYLWRALKNIKNGFYIDVGANDPVIDSITKAFYDKGWRGINIEPMEEHLNALKANRPSDINLAFAIGNKSGFITLYDSNVRGWATGSTDIAKMYLNSGHTIVNKKVMLSTLEQVCEEFIPKNQEIHFLKIDVEGLEKEVIEGANFNKYRPWILLIEATIPNSKISNHDDWEHIILNFDYKFSFFDGLNRYYISSEKYDELNVFFNAPVTALDDFISWNELKANLQIDQLTIALSEVKILRAALNSVYTSHSWRMTSWYRWLGTLMKNLNSTGVYFFNKTIFTSVNYVVCRPKIKNILVIPLKYLKLYSFIKRIYRKTGCEVENRDSGNDVHDDFLSLYEIEQFPFIVRDTYFELKNRELN